MPSEGGSVNNSVNVSWFVQVITFTDKHTGCTFQIRPSIKACDVYHGNQRQPSALWWKERHEVKWSEQWDSDRNKHVVMSMLITLNLSSVSREINGIKTEALTVICFFFVLFFLPAPCFNCSVTGFVAATGCVSSFRSGRGYKRFTISEFQRKTKLLKGKNMLTK